MKNLHFVRFIPTLCLAGMLSLGCSLSLADSGFLEPYLEAGYDVGGDTLVTIEFDDGSTENIKTGSGINLAIGAAYYLPDLSLQATLGYKVDTIPVENEAHAYGSYNFERLIFNGLVFAHFDRHAFGVGLSKQFDVALTVDGIQGDDFHADNALGALAEYRYYFANSDAHWGLRYTAIDYTIRDASAEGTKLSGNAFGLYIGTSF